MNPRIFTALALLAACAMLAQAPAVAQTPAAGAKPAIVIVGATDELDKPLKALVQSLVAEGTEIEQLNSEYTQLNAARTEKLNAAKLVILSRSAGSADYLDAAPQWNALKAPVLMMSPYFARNTRWNWFGTEMITEDAPPVIKELQVEDPADPAFAGMNVKKGDKVKIFDDASTATMRYLTTDSVGNGKLAATLAGTANSPTLVRWSEAGKKYYEGPDAPVAAAPRVYFGIQDDTNINSTGGMMDQLAKLTPEGKQVMKNIIKSLAPDLVK